MKFICRKDNLAKGLSIVSKAIPLKHAFPLLTHVLITAQDGRLRLSGTNDETAITVDVGASVEADGTITIPVRQLTEYVSNLSCETIDVALKDDILHITSDKARSKFTGVPSSDYPQIPSSAGDLKYYEIDPKDFASAINQVAFSVGMDDTRPVFTGVLLSFSVGKLTFVSSDGFRLSEKTIQNPNIDTEFAAIIPAKVLLEVARLFSSSSSPLRVYIDTKENTCYFEGDDIFVSTKLIGGAYPDYKRIIPQDFKLTAVFNAEEFLEGARLTHVFAKESDNVLKVALSPEGSITVQSSTNETGENVVTIPAEVVGNDLELTFNIKYILDFFGNHKSGKLVLCANDSTSACLIKPADTNSEFLHIVMPMQLH